VREYDYARLLTAHEHFREIVPLSYPYLRPHITLAYYRPVDFGEAQLEHLRRGASMSEVSGPVIRLRAEKRVYQEFGSMNRYRTAI